MMRIFRIIIVLIIFSCTVFSQSDKTSFISLSYSYPKNLSHHELVKSWNGIAEINFSYNYNLIDKYYLGCELEYDLIDIIYHPENSNRLDYSVKNDLSVYNLSIYNKYSFDFGNKIKLIAGISFGYLYERKKKSEGMFAYGNYCFNISASQSFVYKINESLGCGVVIKYKQIFNANIVDSWAVYETDNDYKIFSLGLLMTYKL